MNRGGGTGHGCTQRGAGWAISLCTNGLGKSISRASFSARNLSFNPQPRQVVVSGEHDYY